MTVPATQPHEDDILGKAYDRKLMRRLLVYTRPYRALMYGALALLCVEGALQVVGPLLTRRVIDVAVPTHDLRIVGSAEPAAARATVRSIAVVGARLQIILERIGQTIEVEADRDRPDTPRLFPGAPVRLAIRRMRIFPPDAAAPAAAAELGEIAVNPPIPLAERPSAGFAS